MIESNIHNLDICAKNKDYILNCDKADDLDLLGEKALWQSVVMQAALDATSNAQSLRDKIEQAKTIAWFSMRNEDFLLVCSFAELNPELVIRGIKSAIQRSKKVNYKKRMRSRRHISKLSQKKKETVEQKEIA